MFDFRTFELPVRKPNGMLNRQFGYSSLELRGGFLIKYTLLNYHNIGGRLKSSKERILVEKRPRD